MTMNGKNCGTFVVCEEADRLAHELALASAISAIDSMASIREVDGETWRDLDYNCDGNGPIKDFLEDDCLYLELRGALRHHPTRPNLVQIVTATVLIGG